jgi:hypothetical protein
MGSYFKQFSFNLILFSILTALTGVDAKSSPGSDYFEALVEKKPKTRDEMDQIRKDTYDKALINEANTLSKINADHTRKVNDYVRKAEAKAKAEEAAKAKSRANAKAELKKDSKVDASTSDTTKKSISGSGHSGSASASRPKPVKSDSTSTADIKVESNMPDEVDFNTPAKEKGADASAPTPVPSKSN